MPSKAQSVQLDRARQIWQQAPDSVHRIALTTYHNAGKAAAPCSCTCGRQLCNLLTTLSHDNRVDQQSPMMQSIAPRSQHPKGVIAFNRPTSSFVKVHCAPVDDRQLLRS